MKPDTKPCDMARFRRCRSAPILWLASCVAGMFFAVPAGAATLTTLVSFNGTNGANPYGGLIRDAAGNLYGTTESDQAGGGGSIFKVAAGTNALTTLASFNDVAGKNPFGGVTADGAGNFYGTTYNGGDGNVGTIFKLSATNALTLVTSFTGTNGAFPAARLIADGAGNFYGTTVYGGANDAGTVFKLAAGSTTPTTLASLSEAGGTNPFSALTRDAAGNLYGTAYFGGANARGAVFKVAAGTNALTTLASFDGTLGDGPNGGLVIDSAGNLYGTTCYGGTSSAGVVFKIAAGTNALTRLASFSGTNGTNPLGDLILDLAGNLYGTTSTGGASGVGTIFKVAAGTNALSVLATFNTTNGATPYAGLIADTAGNLYGTTQGGGAYGYGTVFQLSGTGFVASLAWVGGTSSNWGTSTNWSPATVPNGAGVPVTFGNTSSNPNVDLVSASRTVGSLTFNSSVNTTIASSGGNTLILDNGLSVVPVSVSGTHTISAAVQANSSVDFNGTGTLSLAAVNVAASKSVTVEAGATIRMASLASPAGGVSATVSGNLKINNTAAARQTPAVAIELTGLVVGGTFDITNHDLILHYAPGDGAIALAAINTALSSGEITSSVLTAGLSLGYVDNAALTTPYTSFDGISLADSNEVLVKYTYTGDANLDGQVTFADFQMLLSGYGNASTWATGDFNDSGDTSFADFQQLLANYGAGVGAPMAPLGAGVPEPASLGLLGVGALGLLAGKRK